MQQTALAVLLDWHQQHPIGDYERHRNAAIHEAQGNRNPLIDHPDPLARSDFVAGFGELGAGNSAALPD
jgi:endonuclease G